MARKTAEPSWIGVDLGGTKMLAVVYDDGLQPIGRARHRTKGHKGAEDGLKRLAALIEEALAAAGRPAGSVRGIGVACPGPVDTEHGVVLQMPNLGWKTTPVRAALEGALHCPIVVINDVDAGIYGEATFGAGRGAACILGVFIGTGIGGGVVYRGEVLQAPHISCAEFGHLPVQRHGPLCGCGRRGCLEAVAGRLAIAGAAAMAAYRGEAPNLMRLAGTDVEAIRSRTLADAIEAGDKVVERIVREAAQTIGWAVAGVVNVFAPDLVVLGGGLVEDMPKLFQAEVEAALRAQAMPAMADSFRVAVAELSGDASVAGAAAWTRHKLKAAGKRTRKQAA